MIQISDMGLADMDTAVTTIFHEAYHHQRFATMGVVDFGGKESAAENYGLRMLDLFKRRMS